METPKYHEILAPAREVKEYVLEKLGDWCIGDALTGLVSNVQAESAKRTAEVFSQGQLFED